MVTSRERLDSLFPGLHGSPYRVTSAASDIYNCIAWAAGETHRWWWPDPDGDDYWPEGIPREESLAAFRLAFAGLGYADAADDLLEPGFDKIALFVTADGLTKHAARQLPTGTWTSKLGQLEDIEHALSDLVGIQYGRLGLVMKRSRHG